MLKAKREKQTRRNKKPWLANAKGGRGNDSDATRWCSLHVFVDSRPRLLWGDAQCSELTLTAACVEEGVRIRPLAPAAWRTNVAAATHPAAHTACSPLLKHSFISFNNISNVLR